MSNFNALANVYVERVGQPGGHRPLLTSQVVHSGTVAECVKWIMSRDYPETYFMTVRLEAGFFNKDVLRYREIEALFERPDFPSLVT
jgi:hypothetical protein